MGATATDEGARGGTAEIPPLMPTAGAGGGVGSAEDEGSGGVVSSGVEAIAGAGVVAGCDFGAGDCWADGV